jgi:uncharacterized protein
MTSKTITPSSIKVEHAFQTNGTLINDAWCKLFKAENATIGISLDGPAEIHDRHRRDRLGRGTFARVLSGINTLKRSSIDFYVIAVLTDESLDRAEQLFNFFHSIEIKEVCFNVEEVEGIHSAPSYTPEHVVNRAREFYREYYHLLQQHNFPHWVREFDYAFNAVLRGQLDKPRNALVTPFRSLNIDYQGNFSTFCPELLGVVTKKYGRLIFGNLSSGLIDDCLEREPFLSVNTDIQEGVNRGGPTS